MRTKEAWTIQPADREEIGAFMGEFWAILKAYYQPAEDDLYWTILTAALDDLGRRYQADKKPLVRGMIFAALDDIEARTPCKGS